MDNFFQSGPTLKNSFNDPLLFDLSNLYSENYLKQFEEDLLQFGDRVINEYHPHSVLAEKNPPEHRPYSPWGEREDLIVMHPSWKALQNMVAKDGVVACGYEREKGSFSRLYQMIRIMVLHPSSAFFTCPLAMTDGAARVFELMGADKNDKEAFEKLTTRDENLFWTSGQWMTEKAGGSDVSNSETYATNDDKGYKLHGKKWFTSAVTSDVSLALAQHMKNGKSIGLSLFLIHLRDKNGKLQNIEVQRLKDKLGTKALPTAELHLNGAPAKLISEPGKGVKAISSILNITRIYNSACSVGTFHRGMMLTKDYATKRIAFGKKLIEHPLHLKTLAELQVLCDANVHLLFFVSTLLGKDETSNLDENEQLVLRLLTPILKLWTAKSAVQSISEICESFGGAGYVEDTEIPKLLRDSQVFPIWEGTTNVLCLDVLRVLSKKDNTRKILQYLDERLDALPSKVSEDKKILIDLKETTVALINRMDVEGPLFSQLNARTLSYSLAQLFAGISMYKLSLSEKTRYKMSYKLYMSSITNDTLYDANSIEIFKQVLST